MGASTAVLPTLCAEEDVDSVWTFCYRLKTGCCQMPLENVFQDDRLHHRIALELVEPAGGSVM